MLPTGRPISTSLEGETGSTFAAIALGVVVLVVVAAPIVNDGGDTGSELPEEAAQLLDDYRDALVNQDVETFYASITDDFFFREYYYGAATHTLWTDWVVEASGTPSEAARDMEFDDPIELIEVRDVVVSGDGPWVVTANEIWEREGGIRFRWDGNFTRVDRRRRGNDEDRQRALRGNHHRGRELAEHPIRTARFGNRLGLPHAQRVVPQRAPRCRYAWLR